MPFSDFFYFLNERLQKYTFKLHVLAKCFWNKFWFYNHFYSENRQKYVFFSSDFCCTLYKLFLIHKPRIVLKHCLSSQQYISPDVVTALIKWQSSFWKRRRYMYHVGILHFKSSKSIHLLDHLLHKIFIAFQSSGNNICLLKTHHNVDFKKKRPVGLYVRQSIVPF